MQASPQPTPTEATETVSQEAKPARPKSPQVRAKPVPKREPIELEPHLEELCDMATD